MPRRVRLPDGAVHVFPDDATDQEISDALSTPPSTARGKPERSWTDTAVDALPTVGGALGGIVGGIGGTAFGMGIGGVPGAVGGATLGGGAGEAAKQLINRARGTETPASATDAALDIGTQGAVQGALEGTGQAVTRGLVKGGTAVYRGYLKPSLAAKNVGKADQIVRTAIDEWLPVSVSGAKHAEQLTRELRKEVEGILHRTPGKVDLRQVADRVRQFAKRKYDKPGVDPSDLEAALKVADRIDSHPSAPHVIGVKLSAADQIKRNLQEGVGTSQYGVPSKAAKTTEKVGAREMRLAIEKKAPEVAPINARESNLIDTARALRQAIGRESNRNALFGVPTIAAGIGGGSEYARTGDPVKATAMALALRAGMHPSVATQVAILAVKLGEKMPGQAPAAVARAAYQAISERQGQGDEVPEEPPK